MENPFRPVYSKLSEEKANAVMTIKEKAMELYEAFHILCEVEVDQRCMATAKTNLETAVMWATKAVTKFGEPIPESKIEDSSGGESEVA